MKKAKKILLSIFIMMASPILFLYYQANFLDISTYSIKSKKIPETFHGYKILLLTDLHSKEFGKENWYLINNINEIDPDIIVVTGDMMNARKDNGNVFLSLASKLVKDFPIFYIDGNHELLTKVNDKRTGNIIYSNYIQQLERMGVHMMNDKKIILNKGEDVIHLRGINIPLIFYSAPDVEVPIDFDQMYMEEKIGQRTKNTYEILLAHYPKYIQAYKEWGADLVLSGHHHGGMIRLPFIGGMISHEGAFFPEYDAGVYKVANTKMVVGRGLGNHTYNIRVFNRPEIVVIQLEKGNK